MALIPAYGRDYKSAKEAVEAYLSGVDFILADVSSEYHGRYCSCRDFPNQAMELRYKKLSRLTFGTYVPPQPGLYPRIS